MLCCSIQPLVTCDSYQHSVSTAGGRAGGGAERPSWIAYVIEYSTALYWWTKPLSSWFPWNEVSWQKLNWTMFQEVKLLSNRSKTHFLQCLCVEIFTVLYMYYAEMWSCLVSLDYEFGEISMSNIELSLCWFMELLLWLTD